MVISALVAGAVLVSLIGYAGLWGRILVQPFAASLISACCGIVCVLFIGALLGVLHPIQLAVFLGGVAALFEWWRRAKPVEIGATLRQPAPVIFVVAYIGFFALTRNMLLIYWDEFALWAINSKYLLTVDRLPTVSGAVLYPDYPPGGALFQYFTVKPIGLSEGNLIFAHAVFQVAALLPILAATRWRDGLLVAPLILIGWVAGYFFGESNLTNWTSIIADNEIGYLLVAAFAIYWLGGGSSRAMMCALPVAAALPLIKQTGLLFSLVFALLVLVDRITVSASGGLAKVRASTGDVIVCLALFLVPMAVDAIWLVHLRASGLPLVYTWQKAHDRVAGTDFAANTAIIVSKFAEAIKGQSPISAGYFTFPAWVCWLVVLALIAVAAQNSATHRLRVSLIQLAMAASLVLYLTFLLAMNVFILLPFGAAQLQGFSRYLGSFLIAWMGVGLATLLLKNPQGSRQPFVTPLVALIACGAVYITRTQAMPSLINGPRADPFSQQMLEMRKNVKERLGAYRDVIPSDSRVYSVWTGTTGLPFYMSAFELKPRPTNVRCFDVGKARFDGDIWSCDFSAAKFAMF